MLKRILVYGILAAALAAGWLAWFATHPVALPRTPYEFPVHTGASLKSIARQLAADGVLDEGESFWILGRLLGKARSVQAGTYRLDQALTPAELLDKLARGDVVVLEIVFVEGTTMRQWLPPPPPQPRGPPTPGGKTHAGPPTPPRPPAPPPQSALFPPTPHRPPRPRR